MPSFSMSSGTTSIRSMRVASSATRGASTRSAIFIGGPEEEALAKASKEKVAAQFSKPVQTQILPAQVFYPAEGYHQNFHVTNAARYKFYKFGCGRAQRLQEIWGDPAA